MKTSIKSTDKMKIGKIKSTLIVVIIATTILLVIPIHRAHAQLTEDSFAYTPGNSTEQCQTITGVSTHGNYLSSERICLGLSGQAVVDNQESDPNHDFYIFTLTTVAINGTGVGCSAPPAPGIGISSLSATIQVPNTVGAVQFQPLTGTQSSQQQVTLSLQGFGAGISVTFTAPQQTIQQSQTQGTSSNNFNWAISESNPTSNTIFNHDATMGVGVQSPEGTSFTVNLSASITISWIYDPVNCTPHYATFSLSGTLHASPTDFSITASPASLSLTAGSSITTAINVQSLNGFGGSVALTANSNDPNFQLTLSPTSVTPGQGGISSSTLTVADNNSCDLGTYTVTVTGTASPTGSSVQHSTVVSVSVTSTCGQSVSINIQAYPTTDIYPRSQGLAVDTPLPNPWWPPYQSGYEFETASGSFSYTTTVTLNHGSHYVQYAASGYIPNYAWHGKIYINGVLTAEGDVARDQPLQANFSV